MCLGRPAARATARSNRSAMSWDCLSELSRWRCWRHRAMTVRAWWDNAKEGDQEAVLRKLGLDRSLAGIPWAFLPEEVQYVLARRVRINAEELDSNWQRAKQD